MILIPIIFLLVILIAGIRIVTQYEKAVIFRLGKYIGLKGPGLIYIIPLIDRMMKVSLRTITMEIPSQKIITRDNVSIDIAAVAYYKITDAEKSVLEIENVYNAINQISQTTVRNVIGQFSLDELLAHTVDI